jgi:hypothetical protein
MAVGPAPYFSGAKLDQQLAGIKKPQEIERTCGLND